MLDRYFLGVLTTTFGLLITPTVHAHALFAEGTSWLSGVIRPLQGLDHLLAMLAVGLWAAQQGGRRIWQLPCAFLSMMVLGASLGQNGWSLPFIESGIASSLLVMGLMLAFAIRLTIMPSIMMVGLFAMFHGYAHGAEMPHTLGMFAYASGFLLSTVALHGLGVASGLMVRAMQNQKLLRIGGIAIGFSGAWLWI